MDEDIIMTDIIINGRCAIIDNSLFEINDSSATMGRLLDIGITCGSVYNKCQTYHGCHSFSILYYDLPLEVVSNINYDNIHQYAPYIQGYLVVINFDQFVEIYDVCTDISARGKGVGKSLISTTIAFFDNKYIWLAVLPENPHFEAAVKLYVGNGFGDPLLSQQMPGGISIGGRWFLLMRYDKNADKHKNLQSVFALRSKYFSCSTPFFISPTLVAYLKTLIYRQTEDTSSLLKKYPFREQSGVFKNMGMVDINGTPHYYLGMPKSSLKNGSETSPTVEIKEDERIVFHTHPVGCNINYGCYLTWPSGSDMAATTNLYFSKIPLLLHFVIAAEGIYTVNLSTQFMEVLNKLREKGECTYIILGAVKAKFTEFHYNASIKNFPDVGKAFINDELIVIKNSEQKEKVKREFIYFILTFSLNDLIKYIKDNHDLVKKEVKDTLKIDIEDVVNKVDKCVKSLNFSFIDFVLFNINFYSWESIEPAGMIGYLTNFNPGQKCPVDIPLIPEDKDIIY
jgi:uncharacterized protein YlzI (FlbEa/FlbD family)